MADSITSIDPDQAAKHAYEELQRGDPAGARTVCQQALCRHPDHPGALFVLGLVEMQDRKHDEAIAAFERLVGVSPNPEAYVNLATSRFHQGQLEPALRAVQAALALDPARADAQSVLAAVLHGLGRYEDALNAALEAVRLDPMNDTACARAGSSLERLGRLGEAETQFRRAESLGAASKPYSLVSFDRGLFARLMALRKDLAAEPVHRFGPREPSGHRFVVMACCDARYFLKYGSNFVNSFACNAARDTLLHVHIVDPDANLDVALERLARQAPPASFLVTTEISPFAGPAAGLAAHTYYSCCRFLQLPGLLARYRKPIVCLDIDAIVEGPLEGIIDYVSGSDIGLIRREPTHSPWLDIPAGVVVANPTTGAARYFELVRDYALHFMGRGEIKWHLDQAALYCVLRMLEHHGTAPGMNLLGRLLRHALPGMPARLPPPPGVKWLPQSLLVPVWQIGHSNDVRLHDTRFTRYSFRAETTGC